MAVHHRPFKYPYIFSVSLVSFPPSSPPQLGSSDSSYHTTILCILSTLWQPYSPTRHHPHATTRVVMDTRRCRSPVDMAAVQDILSRLSIHDEDLLWEAHVDWMDKPTAGYDAPHPYDIEEEDADACDPCLYDPSLFSPTASHPASPLLSTFSHCSDRDKPLPPPPSTPRLSYTPTSTPSSSPRASLSPALPRSRPPSTTMGTPRSVATHATFPSISSTLSLLEERESQFEKRSGVIVTPEPQGSRRASIESTVLAHPPVRKSSIEKQHPFPSSEGSPRRRPRPNLTLASHASSPQLRTLADLATIPASPISMSIPPRPVAHQPSLASLTTSSSSLMEPVGLLPAASLQVPASRWSMDSVGAERPIVPVTPTPESPPSPPKTRKRDRLKSFISRARAGSLGKQTPSPSRDEFGTLSPRDSRLTTLPSQSVLSLGPSSRRTSRAVYEPLPISTSMSTATSTTTSASSASTASLATPEDSQPDVSLHIDPFCPASPTFMPASYLPNFSDNADANFIDEDNLSALEPTLPPPSPDTPSPSLFIPAKQEAGLLKLARRTILRRKKKLVITCIPSQAEDEPEDEGQAQIMAQRRERAEQRRYDCIVQWCENFGVVRRFERNNDGSLHVYWRDWEVADMVCRVSAQVYIKGVGRVSLAWRYVN